MKLALFGYGRMGRVVEEIAPQRGHEIALILDELSNEDGSGITEEALHGARMAIDFSTAAAVATNICKAAKLGVSVVVGTTGWEEDRDTAYETVREAGTGLLVAPNFSIGMLLFERIVEAAARMVNRVDGYDVHLWEKHHRHKVDHPGGTARRLADLLVDTLAQKTGWTTKLEQGFTVDPRQLQVAVSRVGEVPGMHGVGIEGPDDRIELLHEARNRRGFGRGALVAAEWLEGRSGLFTMADVLEDMLGEAS